MTDIESLVRLGEGITPGPWELCQHLKGIEEDRACPCGYRGVIYGPDHDVAYAICQPGHEPAPQGEDGTEPARYPRETELANARAIAAVPDLIAAIRTLQTEKVELRDCLQQFVNGVETHMIDSPADDILANVTNRARQALSNTGEME